MKVYIVVREVIIDHITDYVDFSLVKAYKNKDEAEKSALQHNSYREYGENYYVEEVKIIN